MGTEEGGVPLSGTSATMSDDAIAKQLHGLRMAQLEIVFQPLYRLTVGTVMIVLGSCLCAYGAIYSPNKSCNEMPDYDIGTGGLLILCGCSHLVGMCVSSGSKIRMQVHMLFDICCIGIPLFVLFVCVNTQYWSLTPIQRKECPRNLQDATLAFLAFMYTALAVNCFCAPCFAATLRPGSVADSSSEKTFVYREDSGSTAPDISSVYIQNSRPYHTNEAGTGYADDDRLLRK